MVFGVCFYDRMLMMFVVARGVTKSGSDVDRAVEGFGREEEGCGGVAVQETRRIHGRRSCWDMSLGWRWLSMDSSELVDRLEGTVSCSHLELELFQESAMYMVSIHLLVKLCCPKPRW